MLLSSCPNEEKKMKKAKRILIPYKFKYCCYYLSYCFSPSSTSILESSSFKTFKNIKTDFGLRKKHGNKKFSAMCSLHVG